MLAAPALPVAARCEDVRTSLSFRARGAIVAPIEPWTDAPTAGGSA